VSGFVKGENGISIFVQAIPYNFYALLTLFMIVCIIFLKTDYGPMLAQENIARKGSTVTASDREQTAADTTVERPTGRVSDLVVPVLFLIVGCVIGMIYTGGFFHGKSFVAAFAASNASVGLVMGSAVALIFTIAYYLVRRSLSFSECMDCLPDGFKQMVPAMLILTFAWTLKSMTDNLGAATYVAALMGHSANGLMGFLPAIIFNAASVSTAFAARRGYKVDGWDVTHSLLFTHDPLVMLMAGFGGLLGYLVYAGCVTLGVPADAGAISTVLVGVATRLVLGHGHWVNPNATAYYQKEGVRYWIFQLIKGSFGNLSYIRIRISKS
jgi:hypothetical protein